MKKSIALLSSLVLLLSACASDETIMLPEQEQQQVQTVETFAAGQTKPISQYTEAEIKKIISENEEAIDAVSKLVYLQKFSDETEPEGNFSKNALSNIQFKGGFIFNLLNQSKIARAIVDTVANPVVKKKFNAHGQTDTIARINPAQIQELLSVLKPGDLILCGNDDSFIHAIFYEGNGSIVHSLASKNPKYWGVGKEKLTDYLARSERDKFVVLRYKNLTQSDFLKAQQYANKQVGKKYDTLFLVNDDTKFYCTELVFRSVMEMANPPRIYPHQEKVGWKLITNEDFMDSPDLETVWTLNRDRDPIGKTHKYN